MYCFWKKNIPGKAMPIKCFISQRHAGLLWWWVGRSGKKKKENENFICVPVYFCILNLTFNLYDL